MATRKTLEQMASENKGMGEEFSEKSPVYPAGVYEFDRGEAAEGTPNGRYSRVIAKAHPLFGTVQADALIRVGYVFVREATADDILELDLSQVLQSTPAAGTAVSNGASQSQVDDLNARLEAQQKTIDELLKKATDPEK